MGYYLQFPLSFFCQVFLQFEPLFKGRSRFLLLSSSLCVRFKKLLLHFEVVLHGGSSSSWLLAIIELIFPTKDLRRFKEDYVVRSFFVYPSEIVGQVVVVHSCMP